MARSYHMIASCSRD